jgi:serine/threonine protein kinase
VGAFEYMSPEAYAGDFGPKADIWSLGILLWELRFRENLFEVDERGALKSCSFPIDSGGIRDKVNSRIGCMSVQFRNLLLQIL